MFNRKGKLNVEGTFDWSDALTDAGIIAGLSFFTTLGGTQVAALPTLQSIYAALIAACTQFFAVLAMKRGWVKK